MTISSYPAPRVPDLFIMITEDKWLDIDMTINHDYPLAEYFRTLQRPGRPWLYVQLGNAPGPSSSHHWIRPAHQRESVPGQTLDVASSSPGWSRQIYLLIAVWFLSSPCLLSHLPAIWQVKTILVLFVISDGCLQSGYSKNYKNSNSSVCVNICKSIVICKSIYRSQK